jgi:nucleolar protein 56
MIIFLNLLTLWNTLCVCSEWYSYHFPELIKIVSDNYTYALLAKFIGNRKELSEDKLEGMEQITVDSSKAREILDASRSSMGK